MNKLLLGALATIGLGAATAGIVVVAGVVGGAYVVRRVLDLVYERTEIRALGLVVAGLPYAFQGQMGVEEVKGGSPYGASTITDGDGSRQPSEVELEAARYQGAHVARIAGKLSA